MKKELKDYLHLYTGCPLSTPYGECKFLYYRSDISETARNPVIVDRGDMTFAFKLDEVKLLLRPLSDMTDEEAVEFIHLKNRSILCNIDRTEVTKVSFGETKNIIRFSYFRKRGAGAVCGGNTYYVNQSDPEQFQYLLSKGFDLFGLIEAGLAIDKTKI